MGKGGAYFTEEQYRYARDQANALDYAMRRGYQLKKDGGCYRMREHDSMVFLPDGRWFWNSRGVKGRAIEFVMNYENKTLPEAVLALCGKDGQTYRDISQANIAPPEKKPFELPPKADNCRRLYGYLCGTRKLDRDIVTELIRRGDLYESARTYNNKVTGRTGIAHNAVFVGRDAKGVAHSAFQRGLSSFEGGTAFKRDVPGSDPSASFCIHGRTGVDTVIVFEAAIDAASHASIYKIAGLDYKDCDRIALGGTEKIVGLSAYLETHAKIINVNLALDEDMGGNIAVERIEALLADRDYNVSRLHQQGGKDWNDYLKLWHRTLSSLTCRRRTKAAGQVFFLAASGEVIRTESYKSRNTYRKDVDALLCAGELIVAVP